MDTAKITFDAKTLIDQLDLGGRDETPDLGESLTHTASLSIRKRGVETKVVTGATVAEVDQTLFDNLGRAHAWYAELKAGGTFQTIAARHKVDLKRLRQILQLAFLAPDIAEQIITGQQPAGLTSRWVQKNQLPHDWTDQRVLLSAL